ncbi:MULTISPECIES: alanine/glycine:cation symporter family protein [Shewanella]|jgi:AGCS family alanine or glycine:cation symporter|uniref:AGCS family alanine or glycine:cation symporter n=2 Tax=Shewanella TaxID=22 RepID=A0ABX5PSW2_9GAMM|nr:MULTISPECIES: sodium:alanine symporter family protein [Shewanella]MBZ4678162.1 sodium:alanine symporter family protein [Shewanella sp.]MCA0949029.1 sodium:alanine symporter family protein [Shewanella chilikensis]MCE9852099.1 sodium:alanine symporter family protein [Shewanella chilikensis]MCL1153411.1 sodium:alanine symporter family protein [Shewanella chilikensis]PYE60847.1 AGCS family alanine or glycine:cation symporter [Shewanella chilikensis]
MDFHALLTQINSIVWGPATLLLLVGTGIYLSFRLGFIQLLRLPLALQLLFKPANGKGELSSFAALCTALSATIGTGNIVGVATAIKLGGPGALFWMWVAALFGMATKYAECLLALKFRTTDRHGNIAGGPMYYIEKGLGLGWLAKLFAVFGVGVAFFGIGTFAQVNAISEAMTIAFDVPAWITAVVLTSLVAAVTLGGVKRIAAVAQKLVPTMAIGYVVACLWVLLSASEAIPDAIALVLHSAFNPVAATGGFLGAGIALAIQTGIARGVFSNESGLGSAPIAAAAAKTKEPVEQGLVSMTGTFFDTIIICTMTGLVLILTGVWNGDSAGAGMTSAAFSSATTPLIGQYLVTVALVCFAFTTILGWNYYGDRCWSYLTKGRWIPLYRWLFLGLIASGAFITLDLIWLLADIVNGLMAIPNLIAIIGLRHLVLAETRSYFQRLRGCSDEAMAQADS